MKVIRTVARDPEYTIEIYKSELETLLLGVKLSLDKYPNSDPLIDLLFNIKRILDDEE